jgi:hypothetical protein
MSFDDGPKPPQIAVDEISPRAHAQREFFSMAELADRWRCSRGTVYNRLRAAGAEVLDFAPRGKKGKKVVCIATVRRIEEKRTKRLV